MPARNAGGDPRWLQSASHDSQAARGGDTPFRAADVAGLRADANANYDDEVCGLAHVNPYGYASPNRGA